MNHPRQRSLDDLDEKEKGYTTHTSSAPYIEEITPDAAIVQRFGNFGGGFMGKIFAAGVEARGVERVPENDRENKNSWNNLLMWWSVNTVLTTIPIGVLAQEFFTLTFAHAVAVTMCFGALGAVATAFIATLGPQTGCRTMIIARFSSGYAGGLIFSILNILTQLGFSVVCLILGGQTLAAVNPGTLPLVVGVIIIAVGSLIPCFIGYQFVHKYERYAWIITGIIMLFLWGLGGHAGFDLDAQKPLEATGATLAGNVLSFGGIVFSSFVGWAPVAADYNVRLPANTPPMRVFLLTFFGLWIPICFVTILGAALMTISDPDYVDAFTNGGTGGLIAQVLSPWHGFGKFLLVLLALSCVQNNIVNTYSAGLSMQALGRPLAKIPRFIWTVLAFLIYTIAGVAGREHFSEILSNFLAILGYWAAFFIVIVAEEHFIFRRPNGQLGGYNLDDYDSPSRLPIGIAGIAAGCIGVAGAVVGMDEVWYIGPIGGKIGDFGGDLGFELAAIFAGICFPVFRYIEIRLTEQLPLVPQNATSDAPIPHPIPPIPHPTGPRISVIVVWAGPYQPYFNNFFTSFRANSDTVELIWVEVADSDDTPNCLDISPWTGPSEESNIKAVCLSRRDYWALHRDYFCSRWDCTEAGSRLVLRTMMNRSQGDSCNSWFRLYRGYVFRHLIAPSVKWWGWADADIFLGNFQTQFPWAATEYDVLIPSTPDPLLYLRGHLAFFRMGPDTEARMNEFGNLANMNAYLGNHQPFFGSEESEFSSFVIRSPSITFLMLPYAMVELGFESMLPNTAKFCSSRGVFTIQSPVIREDLPAAFPDFPVLTIPETTSQSLFTDGNDTLTYPIELIEGTDRTDLWFPKEYATRYNVDWGNAPHGAMRYIGRGGPFAGGEHGVWEHIEPRKPKVVARAWHDPYFEVGLYEGLYAHFFVEKRSASWMKDLPLEPLKDYETLVTYFKYGAEIWDQRTGRVVWRTVGEPQP
ncbi:hypothetical protein FRB98_007241 [Tulasnella sp. 332]|nr:hypothetical protein FRB98_007241 [Tulasnella sp. 332]